MSKSPELCPKCGHRFPEGRPDPSWCPSCGELCARPEVVGPPSLPEPSGLDKEQALAERRRWRLCFWLCFLLTPVAVLLVASQPNWFKNMIPGSAGQFLQMMAPFGVVGTFALGALGAGFSLARLHAKPRSTAGLIGTIIAFALGLTVIYGAILFVGCLALMSGLKF